MYRQGDVLLVRVPGKPARARKLDHCVVAEGEVTGHSHRVEAGAQQLVGPNGEQFLVVTAEEAELVHEEHGTLKLPGPAVYKVVHQREYTPGQIAPMAIPDEPELRLPIWARPAFRKARQVADRVRALAGYFSVESRMQRHREALGLRPRRINAGVLEEQTHQGNWRPVLD